ncbi:MAG: hypothetical protein C0485_11610 [Pirellula sp.]|nr:hypothetical protein [Pirellula sp.]
MKTYEQRLADWSDELAAARTRQVLGDLTADCSVRDVERFLENAVGERRRMLSEEMDLVGLAFDDMERLIDEYVALTPRKTFELHEREPQRFLRWLRRLPLTPQQADYVTYQESEYACYELARTNRTTHLAFQRLRNQCVTEDFEPLDHADCLLYLNPVCVWSQLEVAATVDGSAASGDVAFIAIDSRIEMLWLSGEQRDFVDRLNAHAPTTWTASANVDARPSLNAVNAMVRQLVAGGLLACSAVEQTLMPNFGIDLKQINQPNA